MSRGRCSVAECARTVRGRGMCRLHLDRLRKHGSTDDPRPTLEQRFWAKVEKTETCWLWTSPPAAGGYGQFNVNRKPQRAHRVAYELLVGPIPEGLQIDHLCRVRHCVNPEHLEPVTQKENILRGITLSALNAKKTECKHGHAFTPENTKYYDKNGGRSCRECSRLNATRYYTDRHPNKLPPSADRTHCPRGHPYDEENTYVNPIRGGRYCRACAKLRRAA